MRRFLSVFVLVFLYNTLFSQNNIWLLKLNNKFSIYDKNTKFGVLYRPSIVFDVAKSINLDYYPSVIRITPNKNVMEFGVNIKTNTYNYKTDIYWSKYQDDKISVDSISALSGRRFKDFGLDFFYSLEHNFIKNESNDNYITLGLQSAFTYQYFVHDPYALNSLYTKYSLWRFNLGVVHRGGFFLNKKWVIEYSIPVIVTGLERLKKIMDTPYVSAKQTSTIITTLRKYAICCFCWL